MYETVPGECLRRAERYAELRDLKRRYGVRHFSDLPPHVLQRYLVARREATTSHPSRRGR